MNRTFNRLESLVFFGDIFITIFGLYVASWLRAELPYGKPLGPGGEELPWLVYLIAVLCWSGCLLLVGAYDTKHSDRNWVIVTRVIFGGLLATLLLAGILYLTYREVSRLQFVYFFILNLLLLLGFRGLVYGIFQPRLSARIFDSTRVIMIGAGDLAQEVARQVDANPLWGYEIMGYLDDDPERYENANRNVNILGSPNDLLSVIEEQDAVEIWSTLPPHAYDKLHKLVAQLEKLPVRVKVIPDYFSLALVKAKVEMIGGFPLIGLREPVIDGLSRGIKRAFDLLMSIILILLTSPFLLLISIFILLDDGRPILFWQERVGENGVLFTMLKFRTMHADIPDSQDPAGHASLPHKRPQDPRVSRTGRFLRRFSLDELPQLFNVLRGDMSLVGPRPELPWLVESYKPWQRKRFAVPQGLTGWWQINGRSEKPMHLNTDEDLYYIYNYSLLLDILILVRTPLAVLQGRGAF